MNQRIVDNNNNLNGMQILEGVYMNTYIFLLDAVKSTWLFFVSKTVLLNLTINQTKKS